MLSFNIKSLTIYNTSYRLCGTLIRVSFSVNNEERIHGPLTQAYGSHLDT